MHHRPRARPVSRCFVCRGLREAGRLTPSTAPPARLTAGGVFRRDRDRGRVGGGGDVSSGPPFAVGGGNDPSEGRPAPRGAGTAPGSGNASTPILRLPDVKAAHP